jgi:hypothetical protein
VALVCFICSLPGCGNLPKLTRHLSSTSPKQASVQAALETLETHSQKFFDLYCITTDLIELVMITSSLDDAAVYTVLDEQWPDFVPQDARNTIRRKFDVSEKTTLDRRVGLALLQPLADFGRRVEKLRVVTHREDRLLTQFVEQGVWRTWLDWRSTATTAIDEQAVSMAVDKWSKLEERESDFSAWMKELKELQSLVLEKMTSETVQVIAKCKDVQARRRGREVQRSDHVA